MFGANGGSTVREGSDPHSKSSTEHGGNSSKEESCRCVEHLSLVDTEENNNCHKRNKDGTYLVFGPDELRGAFLDDSAYLHYARWMLSY